MSEISESDIELFRKLANTKGAALTSKQQDEMFSKLKHTRPSGIQIEVIESPKSSKIPPKDIKPMTPIKEVNIQEEEESEEEGEGDEPEQEEEQQSPKEENFEYPKEEEEVKPNHSYQQDFEKHDQYSEVPLADDSPEIDVEAENKDYKIRNEKREILFNLKKAYPKEYQTGIWTMKCSLCELRYDYNRRQEADAETTNLMFMKDGLKFGLQGVEAANQKWGPILQLQGWSEATTDDMSKFDRCLKAIYLKFFRKKTMNPFMELLWLVVGSAVIWHLQVKLGQNPSEKYQKSKARVFDKVHDLKPPPNGSNFEKPASNDATGGFASMMNLFSGLR